VQPETSLERIRQRSRGVESGIKLEYLRGLREAYEEFVADISRLIPVIRVSWEQYRDAEEMATVIEREYLSGSFLRSAQWRPTKG
jgi:deoxyadenosine/deoxycytidine kinase